MTFLSLTPQIKKISQRVLWFEPPQQAIADPIRFATYAMTYGTHQDMTILRQYWSDDDLKEALSKAPPGIFDPRSWAYWNLKMDRYPTPPMPQRKFLASTSF